MGIPARHGPQRTVLDDVPTPGNVSAKLVGYGGLWPVALAPLIVAYGIGASVLQSAYQRSDALTAAGTATMVTNAVPIAAGFVLFGEMLPHGMRAVLPELASCTDNAAMIAYAGMARLRAGERDGWDLVATSTTALPRTTRKGRGAR